jgi:hypothetical protein
MELLALSGFNASQITLNFSEYTCLDLECQEKFLLGFYSFSEVMIGENQRVGFCCGSWFDLSQE